MKNLAWTLLIFVGLLLGCKSESTSTTSEEPATTDEYLEDIMNPETDTAAIDSESPVPVQPQIDESELEIKLDKKEVSEEELQQKAEQKKEILKEQLETSVNKGKTCEEVLEEYRALVNEYKAATDKDAVLDKMILWSNDPIYNNCKKKAEYKATFDQLEEEMYDEEG